MGVRQRSQDLLGVAFELVEAERAALVHVVAERDALDILENYIFYVAADGYVEYRHDVRMREHRDRFPLVHEPAEDFPVAGGLLLYDLDRDGLAAVEIGGFEDICHSAASEELLEPVSGVEGLAEEALVFFLSYVVHAVYVFRLFVTGICRYARFVRARHAGCR